MIASEDALFISLGARTQMFNPVFGMGISINNFGIITKNFNDTKEELPESVLLSTFYQPIYFPGVLYCDIYKEKFMDDLQLRLGLESTVYKNIILLLLIYTKIVTSEIRNFRNSKLPKFETRQNTLDMKKLFIN